jgi:hypothetical protein
MDIFKFIHLKNFSFLVFCVSFSAFNTDTGIPVLPDFFMILKYRNTDASIPVFRYLIYEKNMYLFPIFLKTNVHEIRAHTFLPGKINFFLKKLKNWTSFFCNCTVHLMYLNFFLITNLQNFAVNLNNFKFFLNSGSWKQQRIWTKTWTFRASKNKFCRKSF